MTSRNARLLIGFSPLILLAVFMFVLWSHSAWRFFEARDAADSFALPPGLIAHPVANVDKGHPLEPPCLFVECPYIRRVYFVPVAPGDEANIATTLLRRSGYEMTGPPNNGCATRTPLRCVAFGSKGDLNIIVAILPADETRAAPADLPDLPNGYMWRLLKLDVTY